MAKELPDDISSVDVMVVANLASRMGPAITQREMMMISRLAKSSNVDVGFKEVAMITEILKEMGPETSSKEAELVEMIVKESEDQVITPHAAEEISKLNNEIGEFMSTNELKKMKVALKTMAPKLDDKEAAVMTEILNQVGPTIEPEVVEDIAVIAKDTAQGDQIMTHLVGEKRVHYCGGYHCDNFCYGFMAFFWRVFQNVGGTPHNYRPSSPPLTHI